MTSIVQTSQMYSSIWSDWDGQFLPTEQKMLEARGIKRKIIFHMFHDEIVASDQHRINRKVRNSNYISYYCHAGLALSATSQFLKT